MMHFHDKNQEEIRLDLLLVFMAERQGFEPWYPVEGNTISSRAPSTTRPSLRILLTTCISYHKKLDLSSIIFKKIQLFVKKCLTSAYFA